MNLSTHRLVKLCCLTVLLAAAVPAQDAPQTVPQQEPREVARRVPPSPAEQLRLRSEIESVFDFARRKASKDREEVRQLANDLLKEAQQGQGNSPSQVHVLLTLALEAAERVGDLAIVEGAIGHLDKQFLVDGPMLEFESALRMSRNGQTGCKPGDLVRLFVAAGLNTVARNPNTARKALAEAEQQAKRCSGTKDIYEQAARSVATLKEGMRKAKVDAERLGTGEAHVRVAVPAENDADRLRARLSIKATHTELEKRTKREREALQVSDLDEGMATKKNPTGVRYEYLLAAMDLAAQIGDTLALSRAVDELGVQFDVDVIRVKFAAARDAVKRKTAPAEDLMRLLLEVARAAIPVDCGLAHQAMKEAEAQRERHRFSNKLYGQLCEECRVQRAELEEGEFERTLRAAVAAKPQDLGATEQLGWHLCVRRENWQEGLPLLARGETIQLAPGTLVSSIARKELSASVTDDLAWEIAEAWWSFSESAESQPADRPSLRRHAREWYRKLEHVKNLRRRKIESCLREDAAEVKPAPTVFPERNTPAAPASADEPIGGVVDLALEWLAKHQDSDGRWDCDDFMKHDAIDVPCDGPGNGVHDIGVTGLALMALLGSGYTGDAGRYADGVRRGLEWLEQQQDEQGRVGQAASNAFIYDQAIATLAMARASKATGDLRWGERAKAGVSYLLQHKNKDKAWRYQPRDGDNDLCVTVWCVAACQAGKAVGCAIEDQVWATVATYLDEVADETGKHHYDQRRDGSARAPGEQRTKFPVERDESMTAVGLYCRQLLGQKPRRGDVMTKAAAVLAAKPPSTEAECLNYYYWYYGTLAMRRTGGEAWAKWQKPLRTAVLPSQRRDGSFRGSWDPVDAWGADGGRVAATAMLCLLLQVGFLENAGR